MTNNILENKYKYMLFDDYRNKGTIKFTNNYTIFNKWLNNYHLMLVNLYEDVNILNTEEINKGIARNICFNGLYWDIDEEYLRKSLFEFEDKEKFDNLYEKVLNKSSIKTIKYKSFIDKILRKELKENNRYFEQYDCWKFSGYYVLNKKIKIKKIYNFNKIVVV